jgi:hypothetical protein
MAQSKYNAVTIVDTIPINFQNLYKISQVNILPFTETILLRDSVLKKGDFTFDYAKAQFTLSDSLPYSIFDSLIVTYQSANLNLHKEYKRRTLSLIYDDIFKDTVRIARTQSESLTSESIFGAGIEKSGTIVRGFSVGTTKDFTLNSGLRLQLSGKLSEDIEIVAALTDENSPIQPEGNTEKLEELDKVFIQIKHPNATGTFGDYELNKRVGEFGVIDRKLQGLLGEFNYENQSAYFSVAASKGKFNTNNMIGQDGVQGPYRLNGVNSERDIIIIAGTEQVFLDGIELKRGEGNDYVIEYANAEVTFTPNRLITSSSRIVVEFQYTDRKYSRNLFAGGIQTNLFNDKLGIKVQYLREGDDQDAPIDILLNDADKNILAASGDERTKAARSGVSLAQPDSLGRVFGTYFSIDTTLNGESFTYYQYSPGTVEAIYNVQFTFVGDGKGDYIRESIGNFKFVGKNFGSYLPIIFLPLPELKQLGNLMLDFRPFEDVYLSIEYAGSLWDKNRFSSLNDEDNYGYASNIFLKLKPKQIVIGNLNLGKAGISYRDRFINSRFTAPDRFNTVEFDRDYNLASSEKLESESLRELTVNLIPIERMIINSSLGFLRKGESFKSNRYNNIFLLNGGEGYSVNYNFDYVDSKNLSLKSTWLRQKGSAFYKIWNLKPGIEFIAEDKKDTRVNKDSLITGSLKFTEINPVIALVDFYGLAASAKYSLRDDYLPLAGEMIKEARSITQYYELDYNGIRQVNSKVSLILRKKKYTDTFKLLGQLNSETILIRSQNRFKPLQQVDGDFFYEVSTQKSAKLERVFIRVEKGTGNFIYKGDINSNGVADENEYEPALYDGDFIQVTIPSDKLFPVIDLKTSTRWKIDYESFFDENSLPGILLNPLSTETIWRIEENSQEEDYKKIYLLNFSAFQNPDKTIRGFNYVQHDVFFWENDPGLSFRFRYTQRRSLNQFSGGIERAYQRERSMRIRFKMVEEISNQTDLISQTDNVGAPISSNRKRMITSNNVVTDFSYRPERNIEVGFKIKAGRSTDELPEQPTIIDINSLTFRFNLSFLGKGRLRAEIERNELTSNTTENFLPFELTSGNAIGKNYFWRLNFDYRISNNLQSTLNYDGRVQQGSQVIHNARAEVRAYF